MGWGKKEGDINKLLGQSSNKFIEEGGIHIVRRQPKAKIGETHKAETWRSERETKPQTSSKSKGLTVILSGIG